MLSGLLIFTLRIPKHCSAREHLHTGSRAPQNIAEYKDNSLASRLGLTQEHKSWYNVKKTNSEKFHMIISMNAQKFNFYSLC